MDSARLIKWVTLPAVRISNGTLEALKWLAMLSMMIDHMNRFFFDGSVSQAYCVGRLAMPLFAFIFSYNLARPDTLSRGVYFRSFKRLAFFGVLATPAYIAMRDLQQLWPLNILFMFLITAALFFLWEKGGALNWSMAILLFFFGGAFVEYSWQGILFCISFWFYCKKPSLLTLMAGFLSYALLDQLNGNHCALASLPLLLAATQIELPIPRMPYFFYIFYPTHLYLLWMLSLLFR